MLLKKYHTGFDNTEKVVNLDKIITYEKYTYDGNDYPLLKMSNGDDLYLRIPFMDFYNDPDVKPVN